MTREMLDSIIKNKLNEPKGKYEGGFEMDKPAKDWAVSMVLKEYPDAIMDKEYMEDRYAPFDIRFTADSITNLIEIKWRPNSTHTTYPDIMYEINKLDNSRKEIEKGHKVYFLNIWGGDDYYQLYDIERITANDLRYGQSYQTRTTQNSRDEEKQLINKVYLSTSSKAIVRQGWKT